MTKSGGDFVHSWQAATERWENLEKRRVILQSQLSGQDVTAADRERLNSQLSEIDEQMARTKQDMDEIVRNARRQRNPRSDNFVVAELGPDLVADHDAVPMDDRLSKPRQ